MADSRPSSAPLFGTLNEAYDQAFAPEADTALVPLAPGANQFLGDDATRHDGQSTLGPRGNRVQAGRLPGAESAPVGSATAAQPAGSQKPING